MNADEKERMQAGGVRYRVVEGDLLRQDVDVIVNAWNRNIIPWWLLIPQGISGAIKREGGYEPFREVARHGAIPLGHAVRTGAGRLPFKAIIHVAGINMLWQSSEYAVRKSVQSAMAIVRQHGDKSVAFPLIGAGTGGHKESRVLSWMQDVLEHEEPCDGDVILVRYKKA